MGSTKVCESKRSQVKSSKLCESTANMLNYYYLKDFSFKVNFYLNYQHHLRS